MDSATLAIDEIEKVGFSEKISHLETSHTLEHFRKALWFPQIMDRTIWEDGAKETRKAEELIERADAQWHRLLKEYQDPELDPKLIREIDSIVSCAKRDLLKR